MADSNKELSDRIMEYGFAVSVEVSASMTMAAFPKDFMRKSNQAERGKCYLMGLTDGQAEIASMLMFFYQGNNNIRLGHLDSAVKILMYKQDMLEKAYELLLEEDLFQKHHQRALARQIYLNRRSISLEKVQAKINPWKEDLRNLVRRRMNMGYDFDEAVAVVRGFAAENYCRLLLRNHIGEDRCAIIPRAVFSNPEITSEGREYGFSIYDIDLVLACRKEDFRNALQSMRETHILRVYASGKYNTPDR